jgi:hypothetical protein
MEIEVAQHLGVERYERAAEWSGERHGYCGRSWGTRVGILDFRVPRVRDGAYYPALLEPRRRHERALVAVVQEAYVQGVGTRRVDDLARPLASAAFSKSHVSLLCLARDTEVERFRTRTLENWFAYCLAGCNLPHGAAGASGRQHGPRHRRRRQPGRPARTAGRGRRTERGRALWLAFLCSPLARGLGGVRLVTRRAATRA